VPGRCYGVKTINVAPGNAARGLPGLHAAYLLFDATTGVPLSLLDGDELTARRTVAASALAASWLAREDARHLLVVGAGRIARLLPAAYRAVRPIERVTVWARSSAKAEALAGEFRSEGLAAEVAADLEAAVRASDIVSCATLSESPLIRGRWLQLGSHLDLIGGFTPAMREADDDCFTGAAIYIDTDEAPKKSGDLIGPMSRGVFAASDVRGTLAAASRGEVRGRASAQERTVFKSVGHALEDLAAAMLVSEGS
jgi:ornithine cyclodeaminase